MPIAHPTVATRIETERDALVLILPNERIRIPWEICSAKLETASHEQRMRAELSPGGYGIQWPLLDEDLSVNGLLGTIGK